MNYRDYSILITVLAISLFSCKDDSVSTSEQGDTNTETDELAIYKKVYGASDIYLDGNTVVIKTNGVPDHKSPYFQNTEWENDLYEAYNGTNTAWNKNPNVIEELNLVFRIPLHPEEASNKRATSLGPIGVSLNGIPFYNQYAGPNNQPLTNEVNSFDQYYGHPQQQGGYHYHVEPTYLTANAGRDALMGFLLDGFPVYGPIEDDKVVSNDDLDAYHGHSHATADYPNGIYHYHITDADPYINGNGFFGTAGSVSW